MDERELIARTLAGDAEAERRLYEQHVDRIYRLAYRMCGDATLAEDLTQDIFIRAFDRLDRFRGEGPFGAWLHRVATSVILGGMRSRKRVRTHEATWEDLEQVAPAAPAGEPDLRRRLDAAVASLDDNHRLVFVMHEMEGFTHQEIAAAMEAPVGTIKARLSRARDKLRTMLTGGTWTMEME